MSKYYFAYGSCMDYQGRIQNSGFERDFEFLGIACLNGYRFRMNKLAGDGVHVYANIVPDSYERVFGVLYKITDRAESYLDKREGYPLHYDKSYVKVTLKGEEQGIKYPEVLVYIATPDYTVKGFHRVKATYAEELLRGGRILPDHYQTTVFREEIERCLYGHSLYHNSGQETKFMTRNPEFYSLIRRMAVYLGDHNDVVNGLNVTPEMFRILVKLTEMAARDALDLGHMIPLGLLERLEAEFERLKLGVKKV